MMDKKQKELLESILRYVVPTIKKHHQKDKEQSIKKNQEDRSTTPLLNDTPGQLERLLNANNQPKESVFDDIVNSILEQNPGFKIASMEEGIEIEKKGSWSAEYKASFERKKERRESYKVEVQYEKTEIYEALKVTIESKDKKDPKGKNQYKFELKKEIEEPSEQYRFKAVYESNYEKERLSIGYWENIDAYQNIRKNALHDFTDRVPGKWMDVLPESIMGGILGFTYLGQNYMALRQDIIDDSSGEKLMVDVHESIHTPDEYETRVLTSWILSKEHSKYIR